MIKEIVMSIVGLAVGGFFVMLTWLDGWVYFGVLVMAALLIINQNFALLPIGITGMLSIGVFTKINWMDPVIFFSIFIISIIILAGQIVARQMDTGHGTSGSPGDK